MDKRRRRKINTIEEEFGQPFIEVLKDFAKDHSFSFTMEALGLNHTTFKGYRHLFKPRRMAYAPRPHIGVRNRESAPRYDGLTIPQWVEKTGLSESGIRWRIKHGKSLDSPRQTAGIQNMKGRRNRKAWRDRIDRECASAKNC